MTHCTSSIAQFVFLFLFCLINHCFYFSFSFLIVCLHDISFLITSLLSCIFLFKVHLLWTKRVEPYSLSSPTVLSSIGFSAFTCNELTDVVGFGSCCLFSICPACSLSSPSLLHALSWIEYLCYSVVSILPFWFYLCLCVRHKKSFKNICPHTYDFQCPSLSRRPELLIPFPFCLQNLRQHFL